MDGTVIGKGDRPDAPVRASNGPKLSETMDEMLEPLTRHLSGGCAPVSMAKVFPEYSTECNQVANFLSPKAEPIPYIPSM